MKISFEVSFSKHLLLHQHRLLPPDLNTASDTVSTTIKTELEEDEVEIIEEKRTKHFPQNMVT